MHFSHKGHGLFFLYIFIMSSQLVLPEKKFRKNNKNKIYLCSHYVQVKHNNNYTLYMNVAIKLSCRAKH